MAIDPTTSTYGTKDILRNGLVAVQNVDINAASQAEPGAVSAQALVIVGSSTGGGTLVNGAVTTAAPTYVDSTNRALSLDTAGNLRVAATTSPVISDATSGSGTITLGATAQQLLAANTSRKGWAIQNQSTDYLYVRSRGVAGTINATQDQNSLRIAPGQLYTPDYVSLNAQSVIGPTTGQAFWAREW